MNNIIIFGAKEFEIRIKNLIEVNTNDKVIGFCVDKKYRTDSEICKCPVFSFDEIEDFFSPKNVLFLIGIGYKKMNHYRKNKFIQFKEKGYSAYNFIHPKAYIDPSVKIGEGNIIIGNTYIDYETTVGDCNFFEHGVSISHNCSIGNYNYFSPRVVTGGKVTINNSCFFGLNSTIRSAVSINNKSLIGAAAYVDRDVEQNTVIVPARSQMLDKASQDINILYGGQKKWKE